MRVITPKKIIDTMNSHSQWKVALKLWLEVFNDNSLSFDSSIKIRDVWKNASGWNVDRIPSRKLKNESKKGPLDIYIFDIRKNECRIVAWGSPKAHKLFIKQVCSHAEYDKWWKSQVN